MKVAAKIAFLGTAGAVSLAANPAQAQSLDDKFWLEASAYWASVDSAVRLEPKNATIPGTTIDFESDLDLDKSTALPAIFAGARLGRNWVLGAEYYTLSRKSTTNLHRDIVFDDVTYPVDAAVSGKFASDIYRFTVGYAFYRSDDAEFGAAIGLHATNFEIKLSGEAEVGEEGSVQTVSRRREALAPLPTLGLFGSVRVAPKVTASARADYLSLSIDNYDGRLLNAQAAVTYRMFENVGIGAGFRYVDYRLDVKKDRWKGRVRYEFNGPSLFLQVGF
jgi:hypothetical protein